MSDLCEPEQGLLRETEDAPAQNGGHAPDRASLLPAARRGCEKPGPVLEKDPRSGILGFRRLKLQPVAAG